MKKQIMKLTANGIYTVVYDDQAKKDPYKIYRKACYETHILAKCNSLPECLKWFYSEIVTGNIR